MDRASLGEPTIDYDRLLKSALSSILMGIDDFFLAQKPVAEGGYQMRTLSAVRNFYAGILLLLKYCIATKIHNGERLLFPQKPVPDGHGGYILSQKMGKSINFAETKEICQTFGISVDWTTLSRINRERNQIEHFYSENSISAINEFVFDACVIMKDIIVTQLNTFPRGLLGAEWDRLMEHQKYYERHIADCRAKWLNLGLKNKFLEMCSSLRCEACGSQQIQPTVEHVNFPENDCHYFCYGCQYQGFLSRLLSHMLVLESGYDPYGEVDCPIQTCLECEEPYLDMRVGLCHACGHQLEHRFCRQCNEALNLEEQDFGGLCAEHYHVTT